MGWSVHIWDSGGGGGDLTSGPAMGGSIVL